MALFVQERAGSDDFDRSWISEFRIAKITDTGDTPAIAAHIVSIADSASLPRGTDCLFAAFSIGSRNSDVEQRQAGVRD